MNHTWSLLIFLIIIGNVCFASTTNSSVNDSVSSLYELNRTHKNEEEHLLQFINLKIADNSTVDSEFIEFIVEKARSLRGTGSLTYAEISFRIAELLINESEPYRAYEFLNSTSVILADKDLTKVSFAAAFYETKGVYLYKFRRLEESRKNLLRALEFSEVNPVIEIDVYNTLGLIYRQLNQQDSSVYYFKKSLLIAEKNNIDAWKGVLIGNLGYSYYLQGDFVNAIEYLRLDRDLSIKNGVITSAINAICIIIELELKENEIDAMEMNMRMLDSLIGLTNEYPVKHSYYKAKTLYWKYHHNYKEALKSFQLSDAYLDSARAQYDQLNLRNLEFQIDFEKRKNETELLLEKKKRSDLKYYATLLILFIVLTGGTISIYQLRKRKKQEKIIFELENERIQLELDRNSKELRRILNNLVQKNELIETLNEELTIKENLEKTSELQLKKSHLYEKIQSFTLLTEEDLIEFKRIFDKLYPQFYKQLRNKNNGLTNAEMRLAMLIKLDLSNLEMSRILGISQDSVRKTNLRLRKKLEIDTPEDLISFILSI